MNKNSASRFLPTRHPIYHLSLALSLALLCLAPHPAMATNRTVTNTADSGAGSLRDAIVASADGDTIDFSVTGTITLTSAELAISQTITINGPGANVLTVQRSTVSGTPQFRIFDVAPTTTGTVTFSGLTISNGKESDGGGIKNVSAGGTLIVTNCTLTGNSANPGNGGGIFTSGNVNFTNSTLDGNFAATSGGAIYNNSGIVNVTTNSTVSGNSAGVNGGGIYNVDRVSVGNCTISSNSAVDRGGGIFNGGSGQVIVNNSAISSNSTSGNASAGGCGIYNASSAPVGLRVINSTISSNSATSSGSAGGGGISNVGTGALVNNSTISSNSATSGGGIFSGTSSRTTVKSSIIALNTATSSDPDVDGTFTTGGFNLVGKNDGAATNFPAGNPNANNDIVGTTTSHVDPKLDANGLQNNGGPTPTIALLPGSPAIDQGISDGLTSDQRGVGFLRTIDDPSVPNAAGGDGTDIGAFEFGAHVPIVSSKTHGPNPDPLKTFGIDLPLTGGTIGVECRRNTGADTTGPNVGRDHEVILTFPTAVTVGGVSVTSNNTADTPTATSSVSSNIVTVDLHNIANAPRRLTITLTNVSNGTNANNFPFPMGVLLGDTTGDGFVNSADISQTKSKSGQSVDGSNFREDVNVDGFLNSADISLVKSKSGTALP